MSIPIPVVGNLFTPESAVLIQKGIIVYATHYFASNCLPAKMPFRPFAIFVCMCAAVRVIEPDIVEQYDAFSRFFYLTVLKKYHATGWNHPDPTWPAQVEDYGNEAEAYLERYLSAKRRIEDTQQFIDKYIDDLQGNSISGWNEGLYDFVKDIIEKLRDLLENEELNEMNEFVQEVIDFVKDLIEKLNELDPPFFDINELDLPLFKQKANDGIITSSENIYNGVKQLLSNIPTHQHEYVARKMDVELLNFLDNLVRVEFVYILCLILAVYCFDTICNSFFDLFKPLVRQRDQNYEIQRLRLMDNFIQIMGFSITLLQLYTTKFRGYWDWAFFYSFFHLSDPVLIHLYHWIILYCYYPTPIQCISFMTFYCLIVRRNGPEGGSIEPPKSIYKRVRRDKPDGVSIDKSKDSKYDIKITRNIMNVGYELWYKYTVRWNINFAVTISISLHYVTFFEKSFKSIIILSADTYEVINILLTLLWIYGLICVMLGHCARVPFFNRSQESHVLVDKE